MSNPALNKKHNDASKEKHTHIWKEGNILVDWQFLFEISLKQNEKQVCAFVWETWRELFLVIKTGSEISLANSIYLSFIITHFMRAIKQIYEMNNSFELLLLNQVEISPKTISLLLLLILVFSILWPEISSFSSALPLVSLFIVHVTICSRNSHLFQFTWFFHSFCTSLSSLLRSSVASEIFSGYDVLYYTSSTIYNVSFVFSSHTSHLLVHLQGVPEWGRKMEGCLWTCAFEGERVFLIL